MEKKNITIPYEKYRLSELTADDRQLVEAARNATATSFAPHSGFKVGAAARLDNGEIVTGSNQESDVYPAGLCAERVLLFSVLSNHSQHHITTLAVAAESGGKIAEQEIFPCGICTQTLIDAEKRQGMPIRIIMSGRDECIIVDSAKRLMPFEFTL